MKILTEQELATAKTQLELIQAIRDDYSARIDTGKSAEFQASHTDIAQLAYVMITKAIGGILESQIETLSKSLGVDVLNNTPDEQLAEVIELFDGNRRRAKV